MDLPIKILVVQDSPEWQQILRDLLKDYEVQVASSAWEASWQLKTQSFDLAVVDIRLNARDAANTDGMMLIDEIRADYPKIDILVVTAFIPPDLSKQLTQKYKVRGIFSKNNFPTGAFEVALTNFIQEKQSKQLSATVFISYARDDKEIVGALYRTLKSGNFEPWMDIYSLVGGENWLRSIYKAIDECEIFLAVLSNHSVSKRGVVQKELKKALDKWDGMLPHDIYIIPIRLDDCPIPELLQDIQVIDWENGRGRKKLLDAVRMGLKRRVSLK